MAEKKTGKKTKTAEKKAKPEKKKAGKARPEKTPGKAMKKA